MAPKKSSTLGADRISQLPSTITERILQCLSLEDAEKTSILSQHWRYKWAILPQLILDDKFFEAKIVQLKAKTKDFQSAYLNIVSTALLQHIGCIHMLALYIPWWSNCRHIMKWIQFVSAKGVQDLALCDGRYFRKQIPSSLFSCVGLTCLTLINCCIRSLPPTFTGFPNLITLRYWVPSTVMDVHMKHNALEVLISSCPLLQILQLHFNPFGDGITIYAPNLQELVVGGHGDNIQLKETMKISMLSIEAGWDSSFDLSKLFSDLPNLETLVLKKRTWQTLHICDDHVREFNNKLGRLTTLKLVGISLNCCQALSLTRGLFRSSPNLQQLKIKVASNCCCCPDHDMSVLHSVNEYFCLQQLKNVELACISSHYDMQLIKLLLANSPLLEVMTIELNKRMGGPEQKLNIATKLLLYHRASQNAQIVFKE